MDFTIEQLAREGFEGFRAWAALAWSEIPTGPGIYVVTYEGIAEPEILSSSPAGRFKGRDPTASVTALTDAWVNDSPVLYIGKAMQLRRRLRQYRDHGQGRPVGHWGGRYIWQLSGSSELRVAWKLTSDPPRLLEQEMLDAFLDRYGQLPFANLRR